MSTKKVTKKSLKKTTGVKKKRKLTFKQESACQAYIECDGNQSKAYRSVYNTKKMNPQTIWSEASALFNLPHVTDRIIELQAKHAERHNVTVDSITKELDENREFARKMEQSAAMITATMGKAKIHGLVTDKQQLTGKNGEDLQWNVNIMQKKS